MVFVVVLLLQVVGVKGEDERPFPLSIDARLDTYTSYVWRGKVLDRHGTTQPNFTTAFDADEWGVFAFKLWSNWDLSQRGDHYKTTRTGGGINVFNMTPSYTKSFGSFDATVGNIWYTFPGSGFPRHTNSTKELFLIGAYRNSIVVPSLSVYYDYWGVGGRFMEDNPMKDIYVRAALDKWMPLAERWRAGGSILAGWGGKHYNRVRYYSDDGEGFADYQVQFMLTYALLENLTIGGTLAYTGLVGGKLGLDRSNITPDEILWGGVNLRWVF